MGFISKLKAKFTGKGKSSKKGKDQKSTEERYGIPETGFQNNPLYEADQTEDHYGVEQVNPLFEEPQAEEQQNAEPAVPEGNLLNNIGGLPDVDSIEYMAGGLKLDKINRHKDFHKALEALRAYQVIMEAPRVTTVNVTAMRRKNTYDSKTGEIKIDQDAIAEACAKMADFVHYAGRAVAKATGMFASRSSNVQKLTPIFANLLVKAGDLMPKLAHLESAVVPYMIQTDKEQYTFSDIINHEAMGAHAGGLVMSGLEDSNGSVTLSPKQARQAADAIHKKGNTAMLSDLRREQAKKARMGLVIPGLPVGILSEEKEKDVSNEKRQELDSSADKIADRYITELGNLMTALDDIAESYEFTEENERKGVQDQKAQSFRISRLLYRVMNNKKLLKNLIINGIPGEEEKKPQGYEDLDYLNSFAGMNLSDAMGQINADAMKTEDFARLVDNKENDLVINTDYKVGGKGASISILDYKNRRVLRAPKKDDQYLSEYEQKTALNGIRDEASGKVAQFLGFDICAQAEAVGFKARDKAGQNETAVFGGSIMEMADGVIADDVNLLFNLKDKDKLADRRTGKQFQNIDLSQNGKLIEDIMKMSVLDFLIQHNDRNSGNFLINTNSGKSGRMVTAIDNDMVLGFDCKGTPKVGGTKSEEALLSINGRGVLDFGSTLDAICPMMTQDMKAKISALDVDAFNQLLMPYADRLSRMTAVHRIKELKDWAKNVPTCNLDTPEGIQEYLDVSKRKTMAKWLQTMYADDTVGPKNDTVTGEIRRLPNVIIRMIINTYRSRVAISESSENVLKDMKLLGFSKEEAEALILENLSTSKNSDQGITREQLAKTEMGRQLAKYDSLAV